MADQVKTNQYRVYYKLPGQPSVRWDYCAPSFAQLMRNLQHSEGVNRERVEFLFIHQINLDGTVVEVLSIDKQKEVKTTALVPSTKPPFSLEHDESLLATVKNILTNASSVVNNLISSKPKNRRQLIYGYDFVAAPARSK